MAQAQQMIASAVIVPESTETQSPPTTLKRRQSSVDSEDSKRPRFDRDAYGAPNILRDDRPSAASIPNRARPDSQKSKDPDEEKRRGKRLFGALLGALSQSSRPEAGRKRSEIVQQNRARERAQAQEEADEVRSKLEQLKQRRREKQDVIDYQAMEMRHINEKAMANSLKTEAEPPLFYKPYELTPAETQRIKRQINEITTQHLKERDIRPRPPQLARPYTANANNPAEKADVEMEDSAQVSQPLPTEVPRETNSQYRDDVKRSEHDGPGGTSETKGSKGVELVKPEDQGESEDVVVEAGEDSVIY